MSGLAFATYHRSPSALTAIDDWVRGLARTVSLRKPAQLRQLQFHCGNPPPAPEPRTWTRMSVSSREPVCAQKPRPCEPSVCSFIFVRRRESGRKEARNLLGFSYEA